MSYLSSKANDFTAYLVDIYVINNFGMTDAISRLYRKNSYMNTTFINL